MKLFPVGYTIPKEQSSEEGRDFEFAKTLIRYAVGVSDEPLEDWQLCNIVRGNLSKSTMSILRPYKGDNQALLAKINELGIPIVSASLTEQERLDVIARAKTNQDIIGNPKCISMQKHEIYQCIQDVIEERRESWVYEE